MLTGFQRDASAYSWGKVIEILAYQDFLFIYIYGPSCPKGYGVVPTSLKGAPVIPAVDILLNICIQNHFKAPFFLSAVPEPQMKTSESKWNLRSESVAALCFNWVASSNPKQTHTRTHTDFPIGPQRVFNIGERGQVLI